MRPCSVTRIAAEHVSDTRTARVVITNTTRGTVLADRAEVACGLVKRMTGLLTRQTLPEGEALVIPQCRSIHTYGMRFPIDVLFVKTTQHAECGMRNAELLTHAAHRIPRSALVVKVVQGLRPFRIIWERDADAVVELPVHTIARTSTGLGALLAITRRPGRSIGP